MTNVKWEFQRSDQAVVTGEHLVRCRFTVSDEEAGTESVCTFVLTESAAIGMRNDLATTTHGLHVASSLGDN